MVVKRGECEGIVEDSVKRGGCEDIVEDDGQERWMRRNCRGWWLVEVDVKVL